MTKTSSALLSASKKQTETLSEHTKNLTNMHLGIKKKLAILSTITSQYSIIRLGLKEGTLPNPSG